MIQNIPKRGKKDKHNSKPQGPRLFLYFMHVYCACFNPYVSGKSLPLLGNISNTTWQFFEYNIQGNENTEIHYSAIPTLNANCTLPKGSSHGVQVAVGVHHSMDKSYNDKIGIPLRLAIFGISYYLPLLETTPTRVGFFPYLLMTSPNNRFESFFNCPLHPPSMTMPRNKSGKKKRYARESHQFPLHFYLFIPVDAECTHM